MRIETTRQAQKMEAMMSPVQDVNGVCVELTALAPELTPDQWDRVRRLVATLRGVADVMGSLVLPEPTEARHEQA